MMPAPEVSVEEMVREIDLSVGRIISATNPPGVIADREREILLAARDYILAADRELLEAAGKLLDAKSEIAEMRAVTGPKCPIDGCGHWLKVEHNAIVNADTGEIARFLCWHDEAEKMCSCAVTLAELQRDYPDLAREMIIAAEVEG